MQYHCKEGVVDALFICDWRLATAMCKRFSYFHSIISRIHKPAELLLWRAEGNEGMTAKCDYTGKGRNYIRKKRIINWNLNLFRNFLPKLSEFWYNNYSSSLCSSIHTTHLSYLLAVPNQSRFYFKHTFRRRFFKIKMMTNKYWPISSVSDDIFTIDHSHWQTQEPITVSEAFDPLSRPAAAAAAADVIRNVIQTTAVKMSLLVQHELNELPLSLS